MILKLHDANDKCTSIINVMTIEHDDGSSKIKIWDHCDNTATITAKSVVEADRCVNSLYSNGKAEIEAFIDWQGF
jgi:hypothetical protein